MAPKKRRPRPDRKSTRLNSSHTVIYTLSLHDALPVWPMVVMPTAARRSPSFGPTSGSSRIANGAKKAASSPRSEEHTSELQSHSDLHSFPTRRSSGLADGRNANGRETLAELWSHERQLADREWRQKSGVLA